MYDTRAPPRHTIELARVVRAFVLPRDISRRGVYGYETDDEARLHAAQRYFRLPCGQPLQSTQLVFRLPCGQGLQSAQLCFTLPCGQPVQSAQ